MAPELDRPRHSIRIPRIMVDGKIYLQADRLVEFLGDLRFQLEAASILLEDEEVRARAAAQAGCLGSVLAQIERISTQ